MSSVESGLEALLDALEQEKWSVVEDGARRALRERPSAPAALYALGAAIMDRGDELEAIRLLRQAISIDRNYLPPYSWLSKAYHRRGWRQEAAKLLRAWSEIEPDNPLMQFMTAAATGQNVPPRCSQAYVREHHNDFSRNFDDLLVKRLGYQGPAVIAAAFEKEFPADGATLDVLDAGCGTGLCGPSLRPRCRRLVGVDIADKMIARARDRACYDALVVAEICDFMQSQPDSFDAVISSDVLIYFGTLEEVLESAQRALRPGGRLIATLEALLGEGTEPYRLGASGRYSHRESYLREVTQAAGLDVLAIDRAPLRSEHGQQVISYCAVARKPLGRGGPEA